MEFIINYRMLLLFKLYLSMKKAIITCISTSYQSTTGGRVGVLANGQKNGYMGGLWAVALILDAEKLGINGGLGFGNLGLIGEAKGLTGLEG